MMFSTWWTHSTLSSPQPNELGNTNIQSTTKRSTSFRLPKHSSTDTLAVEREAKKHASKKRPHGKKRSEQQQSSLDNDDSSSSFKSRLRALDFTKQESPSRLLVDEKQDTNDSILPLANGMTFNKEYCKVVNLRIPLPSQTSLHTFRHCYLNPPEQISPPAKPKSQQGTESPRLGSAVGIKRRSLGGNGTTSTGEGSEQERQPVLSKLLYVMVDSGVYSARTRHFNFPTCL